MNTPLRSRRYLAGLLSFLCLGHSLTAQKDVGTVIELPPFVVEESISPPWRYAALPGVEIISRTPDKLTDQLIVGQHRLHSMLALMVPKELQIKRDTPLQYIFYIEDNQTAVTREMVASIEKQEREAQAANPGATNSNAKNATIGFMPNFRFWDADSLSIFFVVDVNGDDRDEITLAASYVRYLLEDRTPSLPRWYVEGIMELYPSAVFSEPPLKNNSLMVTSGALTKTSSVRRDLTLKAFTWGRERDAKGAPKKAKKIPELLPLRNLFSLTAADLQVPERDRLWKTQSALFIRWALDPASNKKLGLANPLSVSLQKFVSRTSTEPLTEKLFQECFGLSYAAADKELLSYLPHALDHTVTLLPDETIKVPKYTIRDATTLEISRIKGGLARQEIAYVQARHPVLAEAYINQARRVLRKAYDEGSRDPELLVELGLTECDALNDQAATPFLREATQAGVVRPRAYFELARIEYARLSKAGETAQSAPDRLADIFTLLATARKQSPSLIEVYDLYLRIWLAGEMMLTEERNAIIEEGLRFHPRSRRLILAAALYYTTWNQLETSQELISRGLQVITLPKERAKLLKLQDAIAQMKSN